MIEWLKGKKTYLVAAAYGIATAAHAAGLIDDASYQTIVSLLISGGLATIGAKINRLAVLLRAIHRG